MEQMQPLPAGQSTLESLPDALLFDILCRLTPDEVASKVLPLCRLLRNQAENPLLWQHFCGGAFSGLTEEDAADKGSWKNLFHKVYRTNFICGPHFELLDRCQKEQEMDGLQPFDPVRLPVLDGLRNIDRGSGWTFHVRTELDNPEGDTGADTFWRNQDCGWTPWRYHRISESKWTVARELTPVGCPPCPAATGAPVLVTSHPLGSAMQSVGLKHFRLAFRDSRPAMLVSAWYAGRSDCPSKFEMRVQLKRGGKLVHFLTPTCLPSGNPRIQHLECPQGSWAKVERLIMGYEGPVDEIQVMLEGRDSRGWAGWYGAKFTAISLRFVPAGEVAMYKD